MRPASSHVQPLPIVPFIATGGTIAMALDPVTRAPVPAVSGAQLLASQPGIAGLASIEVVEHSNVPSAYLGPPEWVALTHLVQHAVARADTAAVVVSHGTDSLEETAFWLDLTLCTEKPVVLIGAQRHASEPDSDGPRNLLAAFRVAVCPQSRRGGVLVVMNGQISAARDVAKTHTMHVDAFQCGDQGFLGVVDPDRVVFARKPLRRQQVALASGPMPGVEMVMMHGGCDGAMVDDAVRRGARGIVVQALGLGNVNLPLSTAIQSAIAAGVSVVIATRVHQGRVLPSYGFDGGGKTLHDAGAIFADDLSPAKARILLMLLLHSGVSDPVALQAAFSA